jgi:dTDP-4-dehydrorhamnose reductase
MIKVIVTGADGQLGKSLASMCDQFEGLMLFVGRRDFDICDVDSIRSTLDVIKPDYIVNCAAYTAVDKAESEEEKAFQINKNGVINLINLSEELQCTIIHISTDYVFNGNQENAYNEGDKIDPQSVYGRSKAEGEKALLELAPQRSIIIRTSWLYSEFGHNFLKTMLRLGAEKESIKVVDDQIGIPTYSKDLAQAIVKLISLNPKIDSKNNIFHFSNTGASNWYEFAKEIMNVAELKCEVYPIPTSAFPTAATRPKYSTLNSKKIEQLLNFKIRPWQEALKDCIHTIKDN